MKTGQVEVAEYNGQIPGQLSLEDMGQEEPDHDDTIAQLAASGLIAGRDFDPDTGEVFKNTVQPPEGGKTAADNVKPIRKFI
jgi:hypothetical protein